MVRKIVNYSAAALLLLTLAMPAMAAENKNANKPEKKPETMTVELKALNNSGESGKAVLTAVSDFQTKVEITVTGQPTDATADLSQPAHIHSGSCPTPGAVKWPLPSVVYGSSSATIDVSLGFLKSSLPLAINIHKSAAEAGVYMACGDLPGQKVRVSRVEPSCVKTAISKRDIAVVAALDVKFAALKAALTARTPALLAAWDLTDIRARATAVIKAWKDYYSAIVKANREFRTGRQAAWKTYHTDRRACGPSTGAEDASREGYDSQL